MEPTGRHAEESQDRWQGNIFAGPIHGAQDPRFGASVRQTRSCEAKPGGSEQGQREAEQRRELVDAAPQFEDLLSELRLREVRHIHADHDRRCRAQPATRRRAGDSEVCGDTHIAGALDEMPKAVVVASLSSGSGRHETIIDRFLTPLNSRDDGASERA